MAKQIFIPIITIFLIACNNAPSEKSTDNKQDTTTASAATGSPKSIPSETKKQVGGVEIKINYTAPAVRGREIWGKLVPYEKIWVTGAHDATSMEVGKDFEMGDKQIPAGKYALFTIPGKEEWTVILNKNWNQHQPDKYSEEEDVVRIKVKPQVTETSEERLKYEIEETGEKTANIVIIWEKIRVPFGIEVR